MDPPAELPDGRDEETPREEQAQDPPGDQKQRQVDLQEGDPNPRPAPSSSQRQTNVGSKMDPNRSIRSSEYQMADMDAIDIMDPQWSSENQMVDMDAIDIMDPPPELGDEPPRATTTSNSATREEDGGGSGELDQSPPSNHKVAKRGGAGHANELKGQQSDDRLLQKGLPSFKDKVQPDVFDADNSSSRRDASESTSLQLVATAMSVKSDDSNTTGESFSNIKPDQLPDYKDQVRPAAAVEGENISNIKPDQLPDYKDQVRPAAAVEGENISNIKPDQLPDYKDQVRPAAAAAEGRGAGAGPTRNDGPRFNDQVQVVDEESGGGGSDGDSGDSDSGDDTTTIPWAQSVRALSFSNGVDLHLPTLQAAVLQTPLAADNTARLGGGDTQQNVLRKHMIWLVALIVTAVSISVPLAVILSGKSTTAPTTLLPAVAPSPDAQIKLIASDGAAGDSFGSSVAINGETIVIGAAYGDYTENGIWSGSAYVYTLSGSVWTEQAKLTASDGAASNYFGTSVAINGGTIVIGADTGNGGDSGSAYVYTLSGTVWTEQAKLMASDGAKYDYFGTSVAINGDTIVIGARNGDTDNVEDSGSAYVFTLSGTLWTELAKLTASDGAANDHFGRSVAINGDTIVIGARNGDTDNGEDSGSAYVYNLSESVWTEQAKLMASGGAAGDNFGGRVAINGDTLVIGARNGDTDNGEDSGSAYVYNLSESVWTQQAKLTASDGAASNYFGTSVAINGGTIVIGANRDDTENGEDSGSAYVYTRSGSVWTEQAKLTASDGGYYDLFGTSVAINGGTIVIGADGDATEKGSASGSAYIFFIE